MALGLKKIRLTLAVAEMLQVPMPIASLVRDHFLSGQARGESGSDWEGLTGIAARNSGLFRRDQGTRESIV
jgi:3-hydroxyisobutyrate dehydrogenase-like beta-hydroxyacid dehydrogenase